MDFVLAKVKRLRKHPFQKLISETTLFDPLSINLDHCTVYEPDHNLDEKEWFKVENFSSQDFCIDILTNPQIDSKDFNELKRSSFNDIVYLCAVQSNNFYFQKVTPSTYVNKKMLRYGEFAEVEEQSNRIFINKEPDAVYFPESDTLLFRELARISNLFQGIDQLYREATKEETETFLGLGFIKVPDNYDYSSVSKPNLKRIGLAMKSLSDMNDEQKSSLLDYISSYCGKEVDFDKENSRFIINNDNEMKFLLYGIEQRYYTTALSHERRLANSVKPMD